MINDKQINRLIQYFLVKKFCINEYYVVSLQQEIKKEWTMTFFNQFHKEVTERKMRKIAASQQSPMNSSDFAQYMKRNVELASQM